MTFLSLLQNTILKPHNDRHVYHTINFVPTQCLSSPYPKGSGDEGENVLEGFLVSVVSVINSFQVFQWFLDFRSFWVLVGSLVTGVLEMLLFFLKPSPL